MAEGSGTGFIDLTIGIEKGQHDKWVTLSLDRPVKMPASAAREIAAQLNAYADWADPEIGTPCPGIAIHIPFA